MKKILIEFLINLVEIKRERERKNELKEIQDKIDSINYRTRFGKWGSSYGDAG